VLCDCGLQDSAVNTIAATLKRLKQLKLDCNPGEFSAQLKRFNVGWNEG
jgi:hypothetical protein